MNSITRARAPLRLGLAGGGTDVSPFCDQHGGYVLNATIDRYASATITLLNEPVVRFVASDQGEQSELPLAPHYPVEGQLKLLRAVYNTIISQYHDGRPIALELNTYCDAPVGSGLGSSSTLVVAMVRAFGEMLNIPLDDYAMAQLAYRIERIDCGLQGGRQDQYAATFGGFNFMEFYANDRAIINQLRIKNWIICELEASLLLYSTGVSRESAKIIADQSSAVTSNTESAIQAMYGLKAEAARMKECLLKGDFSGIVESIRMGWEAKKRSAKTVSNPHIEEIYESACHAGALAGKISGAGGGGFMLFYVRPEKRMEVTRALQQFGGVVSNCHFTKNGTQSWRL